MPLTRGRWRPISIVGTGVHVAPAPGVGGRCSGAGMPSPQRTPSASRAATAAATEPSLLAADYAAVRMRATLANLNDRRIARLAATTSAFGHSRSLAVPSPDDRSRRLVSFARPT